MSGTVWSAFGIVVVRVPLIVVAVTDGAVVVGLGTRVPPCYIRDYPAIFRHVHMEDGVRQEGGTKDGV